MRGARCRDAETFRVCPGGLASFLRKVTLPFPANPEHFAMNTKPYLSLADVKRIATAAEAEAIANAWIVTAGLEPGDQLIIDGLSNLREGADVAPVPVTIDANGVVRDVAPADTVPGDGFSSVAVDVERLKRHSVGVKRQKRIRFPHNLAGRRTLEFLEYGTVGKVTAAGGGKRAVERHAAGGRRGGLPEKYPCGLARSHRMRRRGSETDFIDLSY